MKTLGWMLESVSLYCLYCYEIIESEDGSQKFFREELEEMKTVKCVHCKRTSMLSDSIRKHIAGQVPEVIF